MTFPIWLSLGEFSSSGKFRVESLNNETLLILGKLLRDNYEGPLSLHPSTGISLFTRVPTRTFESLTDEERNHLGLQRIIVSPFTHDDGLGLMVPGSGIDLENFPQAIERLKKVAEELEFTN